MPGTYTPHPGYPASPAPTLPQASPAQLDLLSADDDKLIQPVLMGGTYTELVDDFSPSVGAYSLQSSYDELHVVVPWSQRSVAMSKFLGYSYVVGSSLKRVNPICHPFYEFLRCRKINSVQGVKWRGEKPRAPVDLGPAFKRPYYAEYERIRMVLGFETCPFRFKTDAETTEEYERHTYVRTEPGFQSLFIDGDQYKFDTGQSTATGGNIGGLLPFANGRSIPLSVGRVLATWYDVPLDFITNATGIYSNIVAMVNHVNDAEFLGYKKNTLLCDVPHIELRPNPLPVSITTDPMFLADVTFTFHYFEPLPLGNGVSENPGHNAAIFKGDRRWYNASLVKTENPGRGDPDGVTRVYPSGNFKTLFRKAT